MPKVGPELDESLLECRRVKLEVDDMHVDKVEVY